MATNYPQQTITTNLGLSLIGMDEVIAEDFIIIDNAFGSIHGTTLQTNGVPNTLQTVLNLVQGANITLTPNAFGAVTITGTVVATPPGGSPGDIQYNNTGVFGGSLATITGSGNVLTPGTISLANPTPATVTVPQNSPILTLSGQYWATGAVTGTDAWTLAQSATAGLNGVSVLTLAHAGSTGFNYVKTKYLAVGPTPVFWNTGAALALDNNGLGFTNQAGTGYASQIYIDAGNNLVLTGSVAFSNLAIGTGAGNGILTIGHVGTSNSNTPGIQFTSTLGVAAQWQLFVDNTTGTYGTNSGWTFYGPSGTVMYMPTGTNKGVGFVGTVGFALGVAALDSGISRLGAASLAIGNGTTGDFTGALKLGNETLTSAAPTVAAAQVGLGSTTAATATAGGGGVLPLTVLGYLIANVAGTSVRIPYYSA